MVHIIYISSIEEGNEVEVEGNEIEKTFPLIEIEREREIRKESSTQSNHSIIILLIIFIILISLIREIGWSW
jgi:hypothetical protein